ncbi:50S ribosomal protein L25 [Patescibacteria group bacterium]|nr:50S ribosomal protein L25 [Patescibacteria group bacterium]
MTMTLHAVQREDFDKDSMIKAVVYGPKTPSQPIAIDRKELETLLKQAGESTVITLTGLEKSIDVLIHDVTPRQFVGGVHHVDFYAFAAGKDVTAHVTLEFIGEAPVEDAGGTVNKVMYQIEVTGKPTDLPEKISVDVSVLKVAGDQIHVGDLKMPKGVTIENPADDVIAVAEGERAEEPETEAMPDVAAGSADAETKAE